jgi:protein ImuA
MPAPPTPTDTASLPRQDEGQPQPEEEAPADSANLDVDPGARTITDASTLLDHLDAPLRDALWRGDHLATFSHTVHPSGHAALDAELPGGGWPSGMLTELLCSGPGIGEWRLLAPALAALAGAGREVLCIAPPHTPHGPALAALGLPLGRLLWVQMGAPMAAPMAATGAATGARMEVPMGVLADAAWAAEQALKSGACGAVLWWVPPVAQARREARPATRGNARSGLRNARPGSPRTEGPADGLRPDVLRRLHLAAQGSGSLLFLLRPLGAARQSSPAPLRLACRPLGGAASGDLEVEVLKRRGPACAQPLRLPLAAALPAPLRQGLRRRLRMLAPVSSSPVIGKEAVLAVLTDLSAHQGIQKTAPGSMDPPGAPSPTRLMEAADDVAGRASAPAVAGRPRSLA